MNLRPRGVATDAATAALAVAAAGRFLAEAGVTPGRIWVVEDAPVDAWRSGVAVVRVSGSAARDAALATAEAFGLAASTGRPGPIEEAATVDGHRLEARFELGLSPDESVEVVFGPAALQDLDARLAEFDVSLSTDPTPRRLVLAGLPDHGPALSPDLVAAIVHPQVLVESVRSDVSILDMLHIAAGGPIGHSD